MFGRVEWHGRGATIYIRISAVRAITRAAIEVVRRAKLLLSIPGTAQTTSVGGQRKGKTIYGAVRSEPGEPPRKQTGRLRASVTYEVDQVSLTARAGTNVDYGRYLELGTKRGLAPRPWLRRALAEVRARINAILSGLGES